MEVRTFPKRRNRLRIAIDTCIVVALAVLLFNPHGIVGRRVADVYQTWQDRRRIADVWDDLSGAESRIGRGDSRRTIVGFVDYECPLCRKMSRSVSGVADLGVTVVFRHFPLTQKHPGSRDAALAAVCAERYGVFAAAHEAMLEDEAWLATRDWAGLAQRLGVSAGSFEACMGGDHALERLETDRELAKFLGIRGTPSYVTPEGIFEGATGWTVALEGLPAELEKSLGARVSTLELSGDTLFDSAAHPNAAIAMLGSLSTAMFLPGDRLLIQDDAWFHFVDLGSGEVVTTGGTGRGPGEFQTPWHTVRFAGGIAVWDVVLMRLSLLSESGKYIASRSINLDQLQSPVASLVAAHADGTVVFRDDSVSAFTESWPVGRHRKTAHYVRFSPDGTKELIHSAKEKELVYRKPQRVPILFSHTVLDAPLGDALAIAQTDLSNIRVVDRLGNIASELPVPEMIDVTGGQIDLARHRSIDEEKRWVATVGKRVGMAPPGRLLSHDLPANDPAPPIDRMFGDLEGKRLWLRRYRLPGESVDRWEARTPGDGAIVELNVSGKDGTLLDVSGDKALLHVRDDLDVDRVLVRRMVHSTR